MGLEEDLRLMVRDCGVGGSVGKGVEMREERRENREGKNHFCYNIVDVWILSGRY